MNRNYYSMVQTDDVATVNIYGDITSWPWFEGDVSAVNLSKQLDQLTNVKEIHVYINSYGGEVAEGLAIYNALKRHSAKVKTFCDGFACSIASVIFMAGDERVMGESSLLMIHNAWTFAEGNADALRKQADDLEKITQASINAYKANSNLSEEEIKALMDAETWMLPEEAVAWGFATSVSETKTEHASQNAKMQLFNIIKQHRAEESAEESTEETAEETSEVEEEDTDNSDEEEPTADDESDEEEVTDGEDDSEPENEQEKAAQKWSGFFNALIKI